MPKRSILQSWVALSISFACVLLIAGCSINGILSNALSNALGGNADDGRPNPFLSENDPELVRDALPFTLKLLDVLIGAEIDSPSIRLTAAQAYTAYAVLFLQTEANTDAIDQFAHRIRLLDRSKIHLLRARDYALSALEMEHPGFTAGLSRNEYDNVFTDMTEEDIPYLYFAAVSWIAAAAVDILDLELTLAIPRAAEMIHAAFAIDPDYGDGLIHEFYIAYFAAIPKQFGGSEERARHHYQEALRASNGLSASAHLSMALGIALPAQDREQFRMFLERAVEVDPNQDINRKLTNFVRQREARWYLKNTDRFFIDDFVDDFVDE